MRSFLQDELTRWIISFFVTESLYKKFCLLLQKDSYIQSKVQQLKRLSTANLNTLRSCSNATQVDDVQETLLNVGSIVRNIHRFGRAYTTGRFSIYSMETLRKGVAGSHEAEVDLWAH
jgi:hypothetical protein